jgi:hypothetical protein
MPSKMILKKTSRDNSFKSSFTKPNFWIQNVCDQLHCSTFTTSFELYKWK